MNKTDEKVIVILSQDEFAVLLCGLEQAYEEAEENNDPWADGYKQSFDELRSQYLYHYKTTWRYDDE